MKSHKQGLHISIDLYIILAVSVFLDATGKTTALHAGHGTHMIRNVAGGPGNRVLVVKSAVSLGTFATIAHLRLSLAENCWSMGPTWTWARRLKDLLKDTSEVGRRFRWKDWHSRSYIVSLPDHHVGLAEKGITFPRIETDV